MTATMPRESARLTISRVVWMKILLTLAIVGVLLGAVVLAYHLQQERAIELQEVKSELVQQLTDREGEYDAQSIVLTGTNRSTAQRLAKKLGAELRITKDGSFATLTLPEGVSFLDVAQTEEYLFDLPRMSIDFQARISDLGESEVEQGSGERLPMRPQYTVSDASYELQTYLDYINLQNVWNYTRGAGVTVAVIDTGIDTDHPEFAGRISEYSYNATEDKIVKDWLLPDGSYDWSLVEDEQGHGTAVAGVIGASMNSEEIVGIAPEVTLLVIKAECDENGSFKRTSDLVFGLYYAIERDVSVVNMSFGGPDNSFGEAAQLAVDSDIICVAAAGNEGTATPTYPAADPNVLGVGALAEDSWELAEYSNFGDENVDFVAPGTTYTAKMGGTYGTMNGTSFASPTAAGIIALYMSRNYYQEYAVVEELIYASCYDLGDLGPDFYYGYGAIDANALILEARGTVTFNMMTDELENTKQTFIRNHTLQDIPLPERLYAIFDGWYYDPQCTEEYVWYEDEFSTDLTLYANWVNEEDGVPYIYVELEDGTIEIRAYTGHRRYITIPDYIDGKIVSSIGEGAFAGQTRLREVNLPRYLVRIRDRAFMNCTNLISMSIPDTVTTIGMEAFSNNVRLSSVAFGEASQLTGIGDFAFAGCGKLRSFTVPKNVTDLNGSAFFGTTAMMSYAVQQGNTAFVAKDGVLFNHTGSTLVCYPAGRSGEYDIPDGTETIDHYAFAYAKISEIDLDGVQSIKCSGFIYSNLRSLNIPDSVTFMGTAAFAYNEYLRTLKIGDGLTVISGEAFACCINLSTVQIPAGIQNIGGFAFFQTYSLSTVSFEENSTLASIGSAAFADSGLLQIRIPASVSVIASDAFSGCVRLSLVSFEEESNLRVIGDKAFVKAPIREITLPESLQTIGAYAFMQTALTTVNVPAGVSSFGAGVFASCYSLTDIFVDDDNPVYVDVDGVVFNREMTTLVEYPAGNARSEYQIPDGIVDVLAAAFHGTWQIQRITMPDSLTVLGEYSFYACGARQYALSQDLREIKSYAFAKNTNLMNVSMPDSVMQIGKFAFAEDYSLSQVYFTENSKLPRISYGAFAYSGIYSFRVPANVSTIAQSAFEGCKYLYEITFAANSKLESISAYMFDGCSNLQRITFEQGSALTSIQAHALENMARLNYIDFGDAKVTNIDNFAFRFCDNLTSLTLPETVTNIGRYAFYYCKNLHELRIPAAVEHIGRFAFLGTKEMNVYFASETLPAYLDEDWDHGIVGYYLGVSEVHTEGDWSYAVLTSGDIAILKYLGSDKQLDLTTLNLGGDIVTVGGKAFYYAELESIKLPDTLTTIQAEAFYHAALTSISIPASVQFIGREAFAETPIQSLTFANDSKLTVIERSAFENTEALGFVVLPKSLTTLGRAAFKNSAISSLTFADGIGLTEIPEEAFAYTDITSLTLPDGITLINHNAFRNTAHLERVSFGSADFMVMSNVFYQSGLKELHVPANMTYIGEYAFVALPNLTEFTVDAANPYYTAIDGLLVGGQGRKLIAVPAGRTGSLTVPKNIEVIGFGAFEESKLSEIKFLDDANILSLGYRAFYGAKNITEMHIPASVVAIDYYAFANCTGLTRVTFAEGSGLNGVYEGAFYGCKNLTDIQLPDGIDEISDFAFYGCRKLTSIPVSESSEIKGIYSYAMAYSGLAGELTMPETLIDIDAYAFMGTALTKVTIPDTNAWDLVIGIGAFEDCQKLEEITLPFVGASFEDPDITWFGYIFGAGAWEANETYVPKSLKTMTLTEGITFVGDYAFNGCNHLANITIPNSVLKVDTRAFYNCGGLENVVIGDGVPSLDAFDFYMNENLKSVVIGSGVTSLCSFEGCSSLTNINIPDGVTRVGSFAGCSSLTSINIPDGVTRIGSFAGCSSLTSINIPDGVTSIEDNAFSYCSSLIRINIPDSVTSIEPWVFCGCSSLTNIRIPSGVTSIGERTFSGCGSLTSIDIPDSVTNIGDYVFIGCTSLTSVNLPDGVTSIGNRAFSSCRSLTSITVPKNVLSIGEKAFEGCDSLDVVINNSNLPISLSSMDYGEIASRASILIDKNGMKTYWGDDAVYIETTDGFVFCYKNDIYRLIAYFGENSSVTFPENINGQVYNISDMIMHGVENVIIPEGITTIETGAFSGCTSLTSIDIPDSVTSIGDHAFLGCRSLTSINIPDGVTFIGSGAFSNCDSLTSINIPNSVTHIVSNVFSGCTSLASVNFSDSVTRIGMYAFSGCTSLTSVNLPDSLTSIEREAFSGCVSLTSINIPYSVKKIGYAAFSRCSSLVDVAISEGITNIESDAFSDCSSLTSINLPDSVTSIGMRAFSGCSSLTSINIPKKVKMLGGSVFEGCRSLMEVDISNDNPYYTSVSNIIYNKEISRIIYIPENIVHIIVPSTVTDISGAFINMQHIQSVQFESDSQLRQIGFSTFYGCSSLISIDIPEGVTSIGDYAFIDCSSLTSIDLPDSVTSIGERAFEGCSSLTSIDIPDSLTSIEREAFSGCVSLTSINISDSVKDIGIYAFKDCRSLASVSIPSSVTNLGAGMFYNCSSLTGIDIPDSVTSIGGWALYGCSSLTSISIPDSVTSIEPWVFCGCSSLTNIRIPSGVTSIGERTFSGCGSLTSIDIPDSVTNIGDLAFVNCSSLTSISIPSDVISIGRDAFSDCSLLTSIDISGSVASIGDQAFINCSSLTSIDISGSATSIGKRTFWGCSSLTSINLPDSVTNIGEDAFYCCTSLTNINIPDSVTSIGENAFFFCTSLTSINIPASMTSIGEGAFFACEPYVVRNNSDLPLKLATSDYGNIAYGAKILIDKNGNKTYVEDGFEYIDTQDGFLFRLKDGNYQLIAYFGGKETVVLPSSINGSSYEISQMKGVKHVIIPASITTINDNAFAYCDSLKSIIIPDSVTRIGNSAFSNCGSLVSIQIPDSVTSIGNVAFNYCNSLTSINLPDSVTSIGVRAFDHCWSLTSIALPDSVTSIGDSAFYFCTSLTGISLPSSVIRIGLSAFFECSSLSSITLPDSSISIGQGAFTNTAYYDDPTNWENGALYIGNHLICAPKDVAYYEVPSRIKSIAADAFFDCYLLKNVTIGGDFTDSLSRLTNLETIILTELPSHSIVRYFGWSAPLTLKNIVLTKDVMLSKDNPYPFERLSGVTIYVEAEEKDVKWDENFPGWNKGNRVVYGDKWIMAEFYGPDGEIVSSEIFLTSQVIRVPYLAIPDDEQYTYTVVGWDIDGDGEPDTIPATSTMDITAKAVVEKTPKNYTVNFYDKDGTTVLYSYLVPAGGAMPVAPVPSKVGYVFNGWIGYDATATVTQNVNIYSDWSHTGQGHVYAAEPVWRDPTCMERGCNMHICTICGEWYGTDFVAAKGHSYTMTVVLPTCTEKGYELYVCVCGDSYKQNFTEAKGHVYGEWIISVPTTCTADGEHYRACLSCGDVEHEKLPTAGHAYKEISRTESDCQRHGEVHYSCDVCDAKATEKLELAEHNYQKVHVSKWWLQVLIEKILNIFFGYEGDEAYYYECDTCGRIRTYDEVSSSGTAGVQSAGCNHVLSDWETYMEASCLGAGVEARICSVCHKAVELRVGEQPDESMQHSYKDTVVAPTTESEGYTLHECSVCGYSYKDNFVDKLTHIWGDATGDRKINGRDLVLLRQYLTKYDYEAESSPVNIGAGGDVNGDGTINGRDLVLLRQYLTKFDYDTGESTVVLGPRK